ncbi:hypothetical protein KC929_02530 [Patescibacteria group bacterium]|nr:hypothetical protein [Patescibacteria group bacterium]
MKQLPKKRWLLHGKKAFYYFATIVGVICAYYFNSSQIERAEETVRGISLGMYISFNLSMILSLILSFQAKNWNLILQFLAWVLGGIILICFVFLRVEDYSWLVMDTIILSCALSGLIFTIARSLTKHVNFFRDSATKGLNGIFLKSIPQFGLGILMIIQGSGEGLTFVAIFVGHVSILMRLIIVWSEKKNRERWVRRADEWNLISWAFVTLVWVIKEVL